MFQNSIGIPFYQNQSICMHYSLIHSKTNMLHNVKEIYDNKTGNYLEKFNIT